MTSGVKKQKDPSADIADAAFEKQCLSQNAALKYVQSLTMKWDVAANVVEIAYEEVKFFVQLFNLSSDSFPDRSSFLEAIVDSLFQRCQTLIQDGDVLRHRCLLHANLSNFAAKHAYFGAKCRNFVANTRYFATNTRYFAAKRGKFSQHSLLKRSGPRQFFCEIFAHSALSELMLAR